MNRTQKQSVEAYDAPSVQMIEIYPEQCIASSCALTDMEDNDVYDEEFFMGE